MLLPVPTASAPVPREELANREQGGVTVRLSWDRTDNKVWLAYSDRGDGDEFVTAVPAGRALEAFRHPNTFRPRASRQQSADL